MRRRPIALAIIAIVLAGLAWAAAPTIESAAFVLDLAGRTGGVRRLLPVRTRSVTWHDVSVPTRHGAIPDGAMSFGTIPDRTNPDRKTPDETGTFRAGRHGHAGMAPGAAIMGVCRTRFTIKA